MCPAGGTEKWLQLIPVRCRSRRYIGTLVVTPADADPLDIDNVEARGQVKLGGMEWTARSTSGDPISVGTEVRVDRVEGVKVYVTPVEAAVTV